MTGRWAHQRITGKSVAVGMMYSAGPIRAVKSSYADLVAEYDAIEDRMRMRWITEDRINGGKRHTMKRASDRNTNQRLRFAQATLLGWQFHCQRAEHDAGMYHPRVVRRWWATDNKRALIGGGMYTRGPYTSKHRAVVAALHDMGLEA